MPGKKARAMAEETPQPVLVELKTFRVSGHSRGDKCQYRTREEEADWARRDAIETAVRALVDRHGWTERERAAVDATVAGRIAAAEAYATGGDDA